MTKHLARKVTLALALVALTASGGKALAQSDPTIVTGTDPAPDYVGMILAVLHLA